MSLFWLVTLSVLVPIVVALGIEIFEKYEGEEDGQQD